ncbi:hypothetical protein AMK12_26530 [Streptomyces sp. TSRI0395]|nr:hypothetical protein AMK12_26530 [Streptomyces sp. TSRI0395]OKJ52861.1 hypothetical protein AMK28_22070 [Streptomyces sp. CB02115]
MACHNPLLFPRSGGAITRTSGPPAGGIPGTPPCHRPTMRGRIMDAFTAGLLQRIKTTETDLTRAREDGDDFLADVEQGELDDLRRLAAEHGVEIGATSV